MPSDDITLNEIARTIVRIEQSLHEMVRKDVWEMHQKDMDERVAKVESWLQWAARIVIGGVMTAALSYVLLQK